MKRNSSEEAPLTKEEQAHFVYEEVLAKIESKMGTRDETTTGELVKQGKRMFGGKFQGVWARNQIPFFDFGPGDFGIANTDNDNQAGTHWVAVARGKTLKNVYYVYDSFGSENPLRLSRKRRRQVVNADTGDREQRVREDNCGQRCLAWLVVFHDIGEEYAKLI